MTDCTLHIRILSSSGINTLKLRFINFLVILKMHRLKLSILSCYILLYYWLQGCFDFNIFEFNWWRIRYNKFLLVLLVINSIFMVWIVVIYLSERLMSLFLMSNIGDRLSDRLWHRVFDLFFVLFLIRSLIIFIGVVLLLLFIGVLSYHFTNN